MATIQIDLEGGLITGVHAPKGVQVVVRNFDIEGVDNDYLTTLHNGEQCFETLWEGEGDQD